MQKIGLTTICNFSVLERLVQPAGQDQPVGQGQLQREGSQCATQVRETSLSLLSFHGTFHARLDFNGFYTTAIDQFKADTG